jgi:hypothetical protein
MQIAHARENTTSSEFFIAKERVVKRSLQVLITKSYLDLINAAEKSFCLVLRRANTV